MVPALLIAVAVLIALDLVTRGYFVLKVLKIFETKPPFNVPIYPPHPQAQTVEIPTTNGLTLRGSVYLANEQPSRGVIVFFPELEGTHWSAISYAEGLIRAGYDLVSFDFRNQGESDHLPGYEPLHWPTMYEIEDARAVLRYVQARDDMQDVPLGVMGVSRGSQAALAMAAECPAVRAVCCEGAYSTTLLVMFFTLRWAYIYLPPWAIRLIPRWHFEFTLWLVRMLSERNRRCRYVVIERWLAKWRGDPVLFIAGERDNYVHPEISRGLQERIGTAEVWLVPKAKHNRAREINAAEYDRRLVHFFAEHLKLPARPEETAVPTSPAAAIRT